MHAFEAGSKGTSPGLISRRGLMLLSTGAFVKAPPCSTLQVEEDETVGGRSLTTLGVGSSHRREKKKEYGRRVRTEWALGGQN